MLAPRADRRQHGCGPAAGEQIVRVTVQALAGILGGCQSLQHQLDGTRPWRCDRARRADALRTAAGARLRVGVADTVDPLGGSFTVERLTREIEEAAEAYVKTIDDLGGSVAPLATCSARSRNAAYRWQREVEDKTRIASASRVRHPTTRRPQSLPARRRHRQRAGRAARPAAPHPGRPTGRAARSTRWRRAPAAAPTSCRCWSRPSNPP